MSDKKKWYTEKTAKSWGKVLRYYSDLYSKSDKKIYWIFRGERLEEESKSRLCMSPRTHLEKTFELYGVSKDQEKRKKFEKGIIRKFQRKASLYIEGGEPDKDDIIEWLALMAHHGAPTRLMDWTYSFFVSVYFALSRNSNGVVWALNSKRLRDAEEVKAMIKAKGNESKLNEIKEKIEKKDDVIGVHSAGEKLLDIAIVCYLLDNPMPLIYAVNPFRLNKRLTIQQGLFTISGDLKKSFKENLQAIMKGEGESLVDSVHRIIIEVNEKERNKIMRELKKMNISNEVLFPGLDGFARSLEEGLADWKQFLKIKWRDERRVN